MDILSLLSRRNLLFGLAGTAVAAGGAMRFRSAEEFSLLVRPRGRGRRRVPLHTAAKDDWAAQVGTVFTAETGHLLKLTDVQGFAEKSERPEGLRESAFVARFEIERGGPLPGDRIMRFAHAEGGTFDMLLSSSSEPLRMAAIFN
jgi:hypothetical protein